MSEEETLAGAAGRVAGEGINYAENALGEVHGAMEGVTGSGQFVGLHTDKFARLNLRYPLDVEGPEEGHFVRFTVHSVHGAKLKSSGRNSPEENTEGGFLNNVLSEIKNSDVGSAIGGGISGALNAVGGAVNAVTGAVDSVTGAVGGAMDSVTSAVGLGDLGSATIGGFVDEGMGQLGGIADLPGSIGAIASGLGGLSGFSKKSIGQIILYMPHQINESYRANWAAGELGQVGAMIKQGVKQFKRGASGWEIAGSAVGTGTGSAAIAGLQKAAGIIGQESLVQLGLKEYDKIAVNPHMEQFFNGVEFRNFSFTFKFSPRNQKEANEVQAIIRAFKFYSAPSFYESSSYGAFWQYPNQFGIEYWNQAKLHKIRMCACTSVDVNYAGAGVNATFYDGHPVETDLTLNFVELEQMTKADFQQADGAKGGY